VESWGPPRPLGRAAPPDAGPAPAPGGPPPRRCRRIFRSPARTHRVALGAQARDVIRLIVREGLRIVIPGVVLGAIIALVAGRWVAPLLFQVSPKDPPVLVTVVVTLIAVAIAASWIPATRAARVDPNEALRAD
jgi:predicted lysophospholipase L1 biosynthesis ABC-type transport system permease subunit